ncbi:hypothetical protein UG55_100113 [Frankia sp. EI5c]|uniref:hypothetical protein n=1 Tax=Frankia sp. EI5c TaxID=683316 RepID=UPI0007C31B35|nr:hypothetical protein [Frankia sp. EI5c]OAA29508.1 hypothetical protein UG55_100113 [Frankia sp. EI5c]
MVVGRDLRDLRVAISISDSPDLAERGLGDVHLQHAFIELARHILAAGGSLAYGGDLRVGGYTRALFDLLETYENPGRPAAERVTNYLAWHLFRGFGMSERAELAGLATVVGVSPPEPVAPDDPELTGATTVRARWKRAACLTAMRRRMAKDTHARVVLGGTPVIRNGLYPGLYEEALFSLDAQTPLFIVGGYGGAAGRLAQAVRGEVPAELSLAGQLALRPGYEDLVDEAARMGTPVDYDSIAGRLAGGGTPGLRNGLSEEENEALFEAWDADEIVALVLRGLTALSRGGTEPRQ